MALRRPPTTFSDEINAADLAANSVGASELADNAVDTAAIATNAVTTAKIADSTGAADGITTAKLATNAVTSAKITDANITTAKVASSAITKEKIAASAIGIKPHIELGLLHPGYNDTKLDGTALAASTTGPAGSTVASSKYGTVQSDGRMYYYTAIKGSQPIKDPRIGAHFGSQRHVFKSLQERPNETTAHGGDVRSVDGRDWIRLTDGGATVNAGEGLHLTFATGFMEITGYLNDFNLLMHQNNVERGFKAKIDVTDLNSGNEITTWELGGSIGNPLNGRYTNAGNLGNVASSTTLGIHTIRLTPNAASDNLKVFGIELIVQDLSGTGSPSREKIQIQPQNVVSYGKRFAVPASATHYNPFAFKTDGTTAWASGTNNGTSWPVGTGSSSNIDTATSLGLENWKSGTDYYKPYNGGRVVKWVASDGTIKTSVTVMPPNARSIKNANLGNKANAAVANDTSLPTIEAGVIDHSLSEVAKMYHWREFGNGAANGGVSSTYKDASVLSTSVGDIAHVMDDGLTSFMGEDVKNGHTPAEEVYPSGADDYICICFIGTGITLTSSYYPTSGPGVHCIIQNLPYGTHNLKVLRTSTDSEQDPTYVIDGRTLADIDLNNYGDIADVTFHQPQMPPVPDDACIIADYMLMADYKQRTAASGTSGADADMTISKGVRLQSLSYDVHFSTTVAFATWGGASTNHVPTGLRPYLSGNSGAGNTKFKLQTFGTRFECQSWQHGMDDFYVDGTSVAQTERAGSAYASLRFTAQDADSPLKNNLFEVRNAASNDANSQCLHVAIPIHTSSHYQTFETPFLNELVGGDRNMEQTNLIVTADGKTWDQATRNTSYIGPEIDQWALSTNDGDTAVNANTNSMRWKVRGRFNGNSDMCQKNFAYTYNGHICLREGHYEFHIRYYSTTGWTAQYIYVNGTSVAATRHTSPPQNSYAGSSYILFLKRGDHVQYSGGYDSVWGGQYIKRIEN